MSYVILRNALIKMSPTGEDGFEGVSAILLSALTADRYYVARSGDQPTDVIASQGDVAIQGKRYDKTPLDETEFEGDFNKACRLCPKLDCYVLATTRGAAQLKILADALQDQTGVDILLLEFESDNSELAALCVSFWEDIRHLPGLSHLDTSFATWAANEAARPETRAIVEKIKLSLTTSVLVAATVRRQMNAYLDVRFSVNTTSARPSRFLIDLPNSVLRKEPLQQLTNWWKNQKTRVAVVTAEEGMGKSWVIADFARNLAKDDNPLILWLDSADWIGLSNVESIVDAGLMHAGITDARKRKRLVLKALTRWPDRLLIILDGINERGARETAHKLLAQVHAEDSGKYRLLFSTRPLQWKSDELSLWEATTQIPIGRFTEDELCEALKRLPSPIVRNELPEGLVEIAKIPRYFRQAVELRERFKSLANVSKEMVLWADLLAKVQAGDSQVTEKIGWSSSSDLKRALLKLAKAAQSQSPGATLNGHGFALLQTIFGNKFEDIRFDLAEQRVVLEPSGENPSPNMQHVILGFALHLGEIASRFSNEPIAEIAESLRKELEPVLAQDHITEALFVALQLSAFPTTQGHALSSSVRAALLFAWTSSQNARVDLERLRFWATEDLTAYLEFIEEIFIDPISDGWEDLLISPLRELWLSSQPPPLDKHLRRWLKLVWKSHDLPKAAELAHEAHQLPIAKSESHLALGFAATAILGKKPLESFFPDFALAWATENLSTRRHVWTKPGETIPETHEIPCKQLSNNLGPLLRWCYTESARPAIESLRSAHSTDSVLLKGLDFMVSAFDKFGWTRLSIPEKHLSEGKPIYPGTPAESINHCPRCSELAVRDDFPNLCENDIAVIADKAERAFSSNGLKDGYSMTSADHDMEDVLGWFARYKPAELAKLAAQFRSKALEQKEIGPALQFANLLPHSPATVAPQDLLKKARAWAEKEYKGGPPRFSWSLLQLHILAFSVFPEAELKEWLIFNSRHEHLRREIHFLVVRALSPLLVPQSVSQSAREQAKAFADEPPDDADSTQAQFDYWAWIGGISGMPDPEFHEWVDNQIQKKQPTGNRRLYWQLLWLRSATQTQLDNALASGSILKILGKEGWNALWMSGRIIQDWSKVKTDWRELITYLAIDSIGTVLFRAGRHSELSHWGQTLFSKALELIGHPPFERRYWGVTINETHSSGEPFGRSCSREAPATAQVGSLRPPAQDPLSFLVAQSGEKFEKQANEGIKIWRADQKLMEKIENGAFAHFGAARALEVWRDQEPKLFHEYATNLLTKAAESPEKAFHIGGFIVPVVDALLALDPEFAAKMDQQLRNSGLRINVVNEYGVSTFHAAAWKESGKGNLGCKKICADILKLCTTDEELMSQAITAQAEGATKVLLDLCDEFLHADHAKIRALAVSLMAWVPDKSTIEKLDKLVTTDQSGWIRKHAEWATQVARQELATRRHYQQTLKEQDRNLVLARLQVLLPALTSSALWWHCELENSNRTENIPSEIRAALILFWYSSENQIKKARELFGRKLTEYLRGEKVRDIRSPGLPLLD